MQFFNKLTFTFAFLLSLIFQVENVYASNLHFILGADYLVSDLKYSSSNQKNKNDSFVETSEDFKSFSPVIGLSAYGISLEAYILNSNAVKEGSIEAKLRAYGFDIAGEASLSDNFTVIGSLGLVEYTFKTKQKGSREVENDCSGPRAGVGLQYYISRNIAIRAMYHYTLLNSGENDRYKAISEISAGIRFIF